MKIVFIVQGEGRGHMTQAISLRNMLTANGHNVVAVLTGKSARRQIPAFFKEKIGSPLYFFESPNFITDSNNKGVKILPTIVYNVRKLKTFLASLKQINTVVKETKPDAIINFYDPMGGLFYLLYNPRIPYLCLGHQFLLLHPDFEFPKKHFMDKLSLRLNTAVTSIRVDRMLALSFVEMKNLPKKHIFVVPPLLRSEVIAIKPGNHGYLAGYMLNSGYSEEIIAWHKEHPEEELHFFWDKPDVPDDLEVEPKLTFHRINDIKFLQYLQNCKAFASTAGFESVCEAMYMKKPIMMIPTANHFEQQCNSLDAAKAGAGITDTSFNLTRLIEYIPKYGNRDDKFINWVKSGEKIFLKHLEEMVFEKS